MAAFCPDTSELLIMLAFTFTALRCHSAWLPAVPEFDKVHLPHAAMPFLPFLPGQHEALPVDILYLHKKCVLTKLL